MCSCACSTRLLIAVSPNTPVNNALRAKSRKRHGGERRSVFLQSAGGEEAVNRAFDHMQIPHRGYRCLREQTKPHCRPTFVQVWGGWRSAFVRGFIHFRKAAALLFFFESTEVCRQVADDLYSGRPEQVAAGGLFIPAVHHKLRSPLSANSGFLMARNERQTGEAIWVHNHNAAHDHPATPSRRLGPLKRIFINR